MKDILCCIFNYNKSQNAIHLYNLCKDVFDTYVLDDYVIDNNANDDLINSINDTHIIKFHNIYCGGLTLAAYDMFKEGDYKWLMIFNSDVEIDESNFKKLVKRFQASPMPNIGIYEASAKKGSACLGTNRKTKYNAFAYNQGTNKLRDGSEAEGWFYAIRKEVADEVFPFIKEKGNKYGWGIGDILSRKSLNMGYRNVIDDSVIMFHPLGTGYQANEAWREWMNLNEQYEEVNVPIAYVTFGYCTRQSNPNFQEYLKNIFGPSHQYIEVVCNEKNHKTISEAYNEILSNTDHRTVILLHDDVIFQDDKMIDTITTQFKDNKDVGIIGIAPRCLNEPDIVERTYQPEYFFQELYNGNIYTYFDGNIQQYAQELGKDIMIDGCFLAVRTDRIRQNFDTSNKSFHYYDIDFCIENYLRGVEIGISKGFLLRHNNHPDWDGYEKNKEWFTKKWAGYLPFKR